MAKPFFEAVAEILAATNLALGDSVRASRDIQDAHYRAVQEAVAAERSRIVALIRDFETTWTARNRNANSRVDQVFGAYAEAAGMIVETVEDAAEDEPGSIQEPSEALVRTEEAPS